jgi:hypothetical protein
MHEGWHVAGMILTVQVVEKMRLEAQTTVQYLWPAEPLC